MLHALVQCERNKEAADYILMLTKVYDPTITMEKMVRHDAKTEALYELPTVIALCSYLGFIWSKRLLKQSTRQYEIRAELECQVLLLRKSRSRKLREAGIMLENTLEHFSNIC